MRKQYSLDDYIKAVEILAERKELNIVVYQGKKNAIGFKVYSKINPHILLEMWVIHTTHGKGRSRKIYSKEDFKKPAKNLHSKQEEFEEIIDNL